MFWIRLRVSPCSDRLSRSSLDRVTTIAFWSASCLTATSGRKLVSSLPLGPSTRTTLPSTVTLTLAGTARGSFPLGDTPALQSRSPLDRRRSPDGAQDLAADPLGAGLAVAHQPAAGAQDGDPQTVQDGPQVFVPGVPAAAGLADPLDVADHPLALRAVLQVHPQHGLGVGQVDAVGNELLGTLAGLVAADLEVEDVPLVLEHLGQLGLQPGRRHLDGRLLD